MFFFKNITLTFYASIGPPFLKQRGPIEQFYVFNDSGHVCGAAKIFASAILLFAEWALEPRKKAEKAAKIHTNIAHKVRAG